MLHGKLALASDEKKRKVGAGSGVIGSSAGPDGIAALGAVVSTVKVRMAGLDSAFPAASTARTSNVCVPSARPEYPFGEAHPSQPPPSRRHSNLDDCSLEEKPNDASGLLVGSLGPESIVVSGAVESST